MRARRNSPVIDAARILPRMPAPPRQTELGGMETDAAAVFLTSMQRSKEAKRAKAKSKEHEFDFQLRSYELPRFQRGLMFAKEVGRRWQFDFACCEYMLAVEIEGLVVMRINGELIVKGRHASISGFKEDCIKYAVAAQLGWTVVRFEQSQVKDGTAIDLTQRILYARGWQP